MTLTELTRVLHRKSTNNEGLFSQNYVGHQSIANIGHATTHRKMLHVLPTVLEIANGELVIIHVNRYSLHGRWKTQ